MKESEKTALSEKLMGTRHSLAAISLEMERQKRDAQSRQEQDRVGRPPGLYPREKQHKRPASRPAPLTSQLKNDQGVAGLWERLYFSQRGRTVQWPVLGVHIRTKSEHPDCLQNTVNALTSELRDLRAQLEETTAAHAQQVKELQEQAGALGRQRESCMREVS